MSKRKNMLRFVFLVTVIFIMCPQVFGIEIAPIKRLEEIDLPMDFNFSVSDTCSGHAYFMQAAADESGGFGVYSRHINPNNRSDIDLKKVYIDIYKSDGTFLQEVSFTTSLDLAFELAESAVNIYFYNFVVIYDRTTQGLLCYAIPDGSAIHNGLYKQLRSKDFTSGNYVYSCKQGLDGYTKLIRTDGNQSEVLVEMVGTLDSIWKVALPGCASGMIILLIAVWAAKRRKTTRHN